MFKTWSTEENVDELPRHFARGAVLMAFILIDVDVGLVGLMDYLMQPILVGTNAPLPVWPLFFGLLGGLAHFGFPGLSL
ncbi:hypothetical protein YTPLAS18_21130 [Nitrospira sp.]|nr:hypothetical protein YTPLAS18_21130 [Nitrospira sp.]